MIRAIACFLLLFMGFFYGIMAIRHMTGKEQFELLKLLSYSILCSVLSAIVLTAIVVLF